jgi:uncharacterized protein YjiS (DUF1127 family)
METLNRRAIRASRAVEWRTPADTMEAIARGRISGVWTAFVRLLRTWRERHLERRNLSLMSGRDLADLRIPPGMAAAEASRWLWQQPSPGWQSLQKERQYLIDAARWS